MSTATRRPPKRNAKRPPTAKGGGHRRPPARQPDRRRPPVMTVVIAVIVAAGIAAVALSRGGNSGEVAGLEQVRPVTVTGAALPEAAGGVDTAVGATIPEVEGADFAGNPVAIRRDGKPKLIIFMAHWCPHCRAEAPVITDWLKKNGRPAGVDLVSVSAEADRNKPNYPPSRWLEREGWDLPVVVDNAEGSTARAFGLSGFPYFVAVDGQGRVVARTSGELEVDALEALVAAARR